MECDDCAKCKEDAVETNCPFAEDIHGEQVSCVLCQECYNERAMNI